MLRLFLTHINKSSEDLDQGYLRGAEPKAKKKLSIRKVMTRSLIVLMLGLFGTLGWLGWHLYADAAKITGTTNPIKLVSSLKPTELNETNGRVNILLAGYSLDDPGHQGAALTDSIMVVSYDPSTKSAVLLSVPRDLYVNIPGFGYQKINAAYEDGESENFDQSGYDNGGMGLLEEVISNDFNIKTNYYALLDYTAFKDTVNALGGVTLDIQSTDPRGLYDPNTNLDLPNGEVSLDGQQALNLARARGDGYGSYGFPNGDFDRTEHQQQLLVALKNKATSLGTLSNPIKLEELAGSVSNNLKTNLTIGDMLSLYDDTKNLNDSSIEQVTLNDYQNQNLLTDYVTNDGEDALIPIAGIGNYTKIDQAIDSLFGVNTTSNTN